MKAWEIAKRIVDEAQATLVYEKEKGWSRKDGEALENNLLRMKWMSHRTDSGAPTSLMAGAVQSAWNMGRDTMLAELLLSAGYEALETNDLLKLHRVTYEIFSILNHAPKDLTSSYWQYEHYEAYEDFASKCCFIKAQEIDLESEQFRERLYKAWSGQLAASSFGMALNGYRGEQIEKSFGKPNAYLSLPHVFQGDLSGALILLTAVMEKGAMPNSFEIAREWASRLPIAPDAEEIALRNLRIGMNPPTSGVTNNPYREWIGAQRRGAICGYLAPGQPEKAAQLAWIAAEVTHSGSGVIGSVFNAMMAALAFVNGNVRDVLEKTIEMLPKGCEYYAVANKVLTYCKVSKTYEDALAWCEEQFKIYNISHVFPNLAVEIVALWFAQDDFDQAMEIVAVAGLEVSSNAAQVGAIISAMPQTKISQKWLEPIEGQFKTYVRELETICLDQIVEMTNFSAQVLSKKLIEQAN